MQPFIAIPAVSILVLRAYSNNSLTPPGIVAATLTAVVHAVHPWSIFFTLLVVFFLGGTAVTKVKRDLKSKLTLSSTSLSSGGEGPRDHVQVLANSVVATILIVLHYRKLSLSNESNGNSCYPYGSDLLVVGIVSNYTAVAADTFSSELGILSKSWPRLITSPTFRKVPPGTNGGISLAGTIAGFGGAAVIAATSAILMPFCMGDDANKWQGKDVVYFVLVVTLWGGFGSLVDSFLGAVFQTSVVDVKSGKIVEGQGGKAVPARAPGDEQIAGEGSRKVVSGLGVLDNNAVNLMMAALMSLGGMVLMGVVWGVPLGSILL